MKKVLFLALLLAAFLFPARAQRFGSPNSNGDTIYYNITSDSTVEVTRRGDNNSYAITSITIPSTVTYDGTTYTVTGIGYNAFFRCYQAASINLPSTLQYIDNNAFESCSSITYLVLPNGLKRIGQGAFCGMNGITGIWIPQTVEEIEPYPFAYCVNLPYISVQSGNTHYTSQNGVLFTIDKDTLLQYPCGKSGSYTLPSTVRVIAAKAFAYCYNTTGITFPEGLRVIEDGAFSYCTGLTHVALPSTLERMGSTPFRYCIGITAFSLPAGSNHFAVRDGVLFSHDMHQLISFPNGRHGDYSVPDSVLTIGEYAFAGSYHLKSIVLPATVDTLENYSLVTDYCAIYFRGNTPEVTGVRPFGWSENSQILAPCGLRDAYVQWASNLIDDTTNRIGEAPTNYTVHFTYNEEDWGLATVTCHPTSADSAILTVTNPLANNWMDTYFIRWGDGNTDNPRTIALSSDTTFSVYFGNRLPHNFTVENADGIPIQYWGDPNDGTAWVVSNYQTDENGDYHSVYAGHVEVPATVEHGGVDYEVIGVSGFYNSTELTSVVLPNTVTDIADWAFSRCVNLESVTLPDQLTTIGKEAFWGCHSLTSIEMPNTVTSVGPYCFSQCFNLSSATLSESLTEIDTSLFHTTALTTIRIPSSITKIGPWAFYSCTSLDSVILPDHLTTIGKVAFWGCQSLTSIEMPNTVTSVGPYCFSQCFNLASATLSESLTEIDTSLFHTTALTTIRIPTSITKIGPWAFYDCWHLDSIVLRPTTPPTCTSSASFYNVDKSIPVHVPCGTLQAYQGWQGFTNIIEDCESIEQAEDGFNIYARECGIVVESTSDEPLRVYDVTGRLILTSPHAEGHYALPCAGTYLVQVGNRPAKKEVVAR